MSQKSLIIRKSIFGLSLGILLGSIWYIQALSTPPIGYNGIPSGGSIQRDYFDKTLVDTSMGTDGKVKNADTLEGIDSTGYQRRIIGTCTGGSPAVRILQNGGMECRTLYTWQPGDESDWGSCQPNQNSCGPGTQYREYFCRDHRGVKVSDTFCTGPKPQREPRACQGTPCACSNNRPECAGQNRCNLTVGNPTQNPQNWIKDAPNCGFTCRDGFGGPNCLPAPTITQARTPNPGRVGDKVTNSWTTTNAVALRGDCFGAIPWSGTLPLNGVLYQEHEASGVGTTYCDWRATGADGQVTVYRETLVIYPANSTTPVDTLVWTDNSPCTCMPTNTPTIGNTGSGYLEYKGRSCYMTGQTIMVGSNNRCGNICGNGQRGVSGLICGPKDQSSNTCLLRHPIGWDNDLSGNALAQCAEYFRAANSTAPWNTSTLSVGQNRTIFSSYCPNGGPCYGSLTYTCELVNGNPVMRTVSKSCNNGIEP